LLVQDFFQSYSLSNSPLLTLEESHPPSIFISEPFMKSESSLDKNTAAPTISFGSPHLPTTVSFPQASPCFGSSAYF